jgi:hypothetical protein
MSEAIEFEAAVSQVRTLADGGIRVTLDLPEDSIPEMAMLAECKRQGIYLHLIAKEYQENNNVSERSKRKSSRTPKAQN